MLLKRDTLHGIRDGTITLAFRRWKRPTVRTGGTLLTPIGQLAIEAVDEVNPEAITAKEAAAAGFADSAEARAAVGGRSTGKVYRIQLRLAGPDPRIALREEIPEGDALEELRARLARMDARSAGEPWTGRVLELVGRRPGVRAAELAEEVGLETAPFKARVRRLKKLGLTESLEIGYRLSPRGEAVAARRG